MRILVIGGFHHGSLTESYTSAFEQLGHQVFRFDSDQAYFQAASWAGNRWLRRLSRSLLWNRVNRSTINMVADVRPKLVFVVKGTYLHAETIRDIRLRLGIPVVNYYSDNPYCGVPLNPRKTSAQRRDLIQVLREYSHIFIWGKHLVTRLEDDGVCASYLPFGVDSEIYRPFPRGICEECHQSHQVVLVGQHNKKRGTAVEFIKRHRVGIWGPGWQKMAHCYNGLHTFHGSRVFGKDCARVYGDAEVSLNIVDDLNMPGHNMRTFEIPASGGVMLSTYTAEQAEFFPPWEAACYYEQPAGLDDIFERLLADVEVREHIRENALKLSQQHNYINRSSELLNKIFA